MIEITKESKYARCLSCFSQKQVFALIIRQKSSNHSYTISLCNKCMQKLRNKIDTLEVEE